ncbi:hypothetical protein AI29_00665, partial [bacteria symbiont BFo2 of Frankliniella occidentalis]
NKLRGLSIQMDSKQASLPTVVKNYASEGIIQFFFEDHAPAQSFSIYVLDEQNHAEVYQHCEGSKEELMRDVCRFYSSSHDRLTFGTSSINFNLPQFYQVVEQQGRSTIINFHSPSQDEVTERVSPQLGQNILPRSPYRP